MKLSPDDLFLLSQQAIVAAVQAGEIISKYRDDPVSVRTKKGGISFASQVVTDVDHLCQDVILQVLKPTFESFDLGLLAEESQDDLKRLEKDFFWSIDPLDGTLSFIQATPGYSVSIALVSRDGVSYIGVIYDPVQQIIYHAIKEQGVYRNGKLWTLSKSAVTSMTAFTLIFDRSFKQNQLFLETIEKMKDIAFSMGYKRIHTILHGGAAMNACWVLENPPACYFKFPKAQIGGGSLWDYAASTCLFDESGAIAVDIFGAPLDLNRPDSTFMNHRGVIFASDEKIAEQIMDLYTKLYNG